MLALQDLATVQKEQLQLAQPAETSKKPSIKAVPVKEKKAALQEPRAKTAYNVCPLLISEQPAIASCLTHLSAALKYMTVLSLQLGNVA